jgi:hypothetical protein
LIVPKFINPIVRSTITNTNKRRILIIASAIVMYANEFISPLLIDVMPTSFIFPPSQFPHTDSPENKSHQQLVVSGLMSRTRITTTLMRVDKANARFRTVSFSES